MTSPLLAVFDLIETTFAAVTPTDRPEVLFAHVEGEGTDPGKSSDRTFWFEPLSGCDVVQFDSVDMTVLETAFLLRVRFVLDGTSKRDRAKRIATEIVLLLRAVNTIPESSFPDGVRGLLSDSVGTERRGEELFATFNFKAQTEEVD